MVIMGVYGYACMWGYVDACGGADGYSARVCVCACIW